MMFCGAAIGDDRQASAMQGDKAKSLLADDQGETMTRLKVAVQRFCVPLLTRNPM